MPLLLLLLRYQDKKVPAMGPGRVHFAHIRDFLAPYNTGTCIACPARIYTHMYVYMRRSRVEAYRGASDSAPNPLGADADQFEHVANNLQQRGPRPADEIVASALRFYEHGFGAYNCAVHNCEDFAMQCVYSNPPRLSNQTKVMPLDFVRFRTGNLLLLICGTCSLLFTCTCCMRILIDSFQGINRCVSARV